MRKFLIAVCLNLLLHLSSVYSLELDIPLVNQEMSEWCWAACSQMALEYYGAPDSRSIALANCMFRAGIIPMSK